MTLIFYANWGLYQWYLDFSTPDIVHRLMAWRYVQFTINSSFRIFYLLYRDLKRSRAWVIFQRIRHLEIEEALAVHWFINLLRDTDRRVYPSYYNVVDMECTLFSEQSLENRPSYHLRSNMQRIRRISIGIRGTSVHSRPNR